jgi:hypothetical protein
MAAPAAPHLQPVRQHRAVDPSPLVITPEQMEEPVGYFEKR